MDLVSGAIRNLQKSNHVTASSPTRPLNAASEHGEPEERSTYGRVERERISAQAQRGQPTESITASSRAPASGQPVNRLRREDLVPRGRPGVEGDDRARQEEQPYLRDDDTQPRTRVNPASPRRQERERR